MRYVCTYLELACGAVKDVHISKCGTSLSQEL